MEGARQGRLKCSSVADGGAEGIGRGLGTWTRQLLFVESDDPDLRPDVSFGPNVRALVSPLGHFIDSLTPPEVAIIKGWLRL